MLLLRVIIGTIAGVLKFGPHVIKWSVLDLLGVDRLPAYDPDAAEQLGASLLRHAESGVGGTDSFEDVTITAEDGVRLHAVADTGGRRVGGKRPIVFVHGFPELWVSWMDQMEHFARLGHPILALSMRGYGMSDKPPGVDNYNLDHLVKDVGAAVDYATTDLVKGHAARLKPLLVAHDWGANVCWRFVCGKRNAGRVAGYASLTVPPPRAIRDNMTPRQLWASMYMPFLTVPWLPEKLCLLNDAWCVGTIVSDTKRASLPAWLINAYRANVLQGGAMEAQLNYYRSWLAGGSKGAQDDDNDGDYGTKENRLPLPVLVVRAADDAYLGGDIFRSLELYLENSRLVVLDNCSHWVQADCPDEVCGEIAAFLDEL